MKENRPGLDVGRPSGVFGGWGARLGRLPGLGIMRGRPCARFLLGLDLANRRAAWVENLASGPDEGVHLRASFGWDEVGAFESSLGGYFEESEADLDFAICGAAEEWRGHALGQVLRRGPFGRLLPRSVHKVWRDRRHFRSSRLECQAAGAYYTAGERVMLVVSVDATGTVGAFLGTSGHLLDLGLLGNQADDAFLRAAVAAGRTTRAVVVGPNLGKPEGERLVSRLGAMGVVADRRAEPCVAEGAALLFAGRERQGAWVPKVAPAGVSIG